MTMTFLSFYVNSMLHFPNNCLYTYVYKLFINSRLLSLIILCISSISGISHFTLHYEQYINI